MVNRFIQMMVLFSNLHSPVATANEVCDRAGIFGNIALVTQRQKHSILEAGWQTLDLRTRGFISSI